MLVYTLNVNTCISYRTFNICINKNTHNNAFPAINSPKIWMDRFCECCRNIEILLFQKTLYLFVVFFSFISYVKSLYVVCCSIYDKTFDFGKRVLNIDTCMSRMTKWMLSIFNQYYITFFNSFFHGNVEDRVYQRISSQWLLLYIQCTRKLLWNMKNCEKSPFGMVQRQYLSR